MKTSHPDQSRNMIAVAIFIAILLSAAFKSCGQCVTDTALFPYDFFQHCWTAPLNATDEFQPTCPTWYNGGGFVYEFYSDGVNPVSIIVDSKLNYDFEPDGMVWAHAFITDGCQGPTLWSTSASCINSPMVDVVADTSPGFDWSVDILLPEGMFYLHIGNVGLSNVQDNIEGYLDVLIGTSGFLGLHIGLRNFSEGSTYNVWSEFDFLGRRY